MPVKHTRIKKKKADWKKLRKQLDELSEFLDQYDYEDQSLGDAKLLEVAFKECAANLRARLDKAEKQHAKYVKHSES